MQADESSSSRGTHVIGADGARPRIALYGTFDVLNYGDLLFPHLLRHGLGPAAHEIVGFSPVGVRLAWRDTVVARPIREAPDFAADLHVIGGGNIVHAGPTTLADYAREPADPRLAYASLWLGAGLIAAQAATNLSWNAPGLPSPILDERIGNLRDDILAASTYVSVRDSASLDFLGVPAAIPAAVVPDTALDIGRVWPAASLLDHARRAFEERGAAVPRSWLVVHLNARYLDGDARLLAALVDAIGAAVDALPVLVAFGPCHGDDQLAREVGALLRGPSLIVDRPAGLKEVAALLAHASGYVGSSMHGLITALSYGRPAIAVAKRGMIKFPGFLDHVDMPERLAESWEQALALAPRLLGALDGPALAAIARAQDRIALHWERLRESIDEPAGAAVVEARVRLQKWMEEASGEFKDWRAYATVVDASTAPSAPAATETPPGGQCNICGQSGFRPHVPSLPDQVGFGARCAGCGASARDRAMRIVFDRWRSPAAARLHCLRLGINRVVAGGWFASLRDIDVESGSVVDLGELAAARAEADLVVCMDVLERVADPATALEALRGALRPGGLLFLSFRNLPGRTQTVDWGFPRGDGDHEYRKFGADVAATLGGLWSEAWIAIANPADPLTGIRTLLYVLARSQDDLRWLLESDVDHRVLRPHGQGAAGTERSEP